MFQYALNVVLLVAIAVLGTLHVHLRSTAQDYALAKQQSTEQLGRSISEAEAAKTRYAEERKHLLEQISQSASKLEQLAVLQAKLTTMQAENSGLKTQLAAASLQQQQPTTAPTAEAILPQGTIVTITSNVDNSRQVSDQVAREELKRTALQKELDLAKTRLSKMKTEKELVPDPLYPNEPYRQVWRPKYSSDQIEGAAAEQSRINADLRATNGRIIALQKELATRRLTGQLQDGKPVEIVVTGAAELVAAQSLKVGQRYAIEGSTKQEGAKMIIKFVMATPVK